MVSLRPLLRFSRALGRQVFPVDGSVGGRAGIQSMALSCVSMGTESGKESEVLGPSQAGRVPNIYLTR